MSNLFNGSPYCPQKDDYLYLPKKDSNGTKVTEEGKTTIALVLPLSTARYEGFVWWRFWEIFILPGHLWISPEMDSFKAFRQSKPFEFHVWGVTSTRWYWLESVQVDDEQWLTWFPPVSDHQCKALHRPLNITKSLDTKHKIVELVRSDGGFASWLQRITAYRMDKKTGIDLDFMGRFLNQLVESLPWLV